ncbi:YcbK family protein [Celeribacter sp. ULVN23_4]
MTLTRRAFISSAFAAGATLATPALALSVPNLQVQNVHTGESFALPFTGRVNKAEVEQFRSVTRDYHVNAEHDMDLRLLSLLSAICEKAGSDQPFRLLSGYRTPETNSHIRNASKHSYHLKGQALDIFRADLSTRELRNIALSLGAGGVGYYPRHGFVHVDTGPVRSWNG